MAEFADEVDFNTIGREIHNAVAKDEKYQRENDAKFRAINQKVKNYDEFRDIVAASHLKPLDKGDKLGGMSYQKWNALTNNTGQKCNTGNKESQQSELRASLEAPKTSQEFMRSWKRNCRTPEEKCAFLFCLDRATLQNCLTLECPVGEIVQAIHSCSTFEAQRSKVAEILEVITTSKRFELELDFLSNVEKQYLSDIFTKLKSFHEVTNGQVGIDKLMISYRMEKS